MQNLTEKEKAVVRALQGDFPLVADPYAQLAESVGLTKEDFLATVKSMQDEKKIRKMGAVLAHRNVGFKANVLVAWAVPQERLEEVARVMVDSPSVSHCYDRNVAPGWPYNLYTMIHGHSRAECESIADTLGKENHIENRVMLYSKKEWKKTSMKYFSE